MHPKFAIAYTQLLFDERDGNAGSITRLVEGQVFQTAALAHKVAGRLEQHDWEHGGDGGYSVRDLATGRPHYRPLNVQLDDFIPF